MLNREIIAVCSQIHIKHINILCGQNVESLNVTLLVHIMTTGLYRVKKQSFAYCLTKDTDLPSDHLFLQNKLFS